MTRAVTLANLVAEDILTVDNVTDRVGIGTTTPSAQFQVGIGVSVYGNSGIVSATKFYGDGSNLSGITGGATLSAGSGDQRVVITSLTSGTMTSAATDAELTYNSGTNTLTATTFKGNVTGVAATFTGNVSIGGTLTYEDVTNIDSVGLVTARTGLRVLAGGINAVGFSTFSAIRLGDGDASNTNNLKFGADNDLNIYHNGSHAFLQNQTGNVYLRSSSGTSINIEPAAGAAGIIANATGDVELYFNNSKKLETTAAGVTVTGTVSDSIGPLRRLGVNAQGGAYAFVVGDAGKIIRSSGSGSALTLNQNIFTAGDMISVFNVGSGTNTVVPGTGVTLYNTADATQTGTRTIAAKGMCTIVCTASNEFAISGSQLT